MTKQLIVRWPRTRTGKLIFTSTNRALEAALEYFDTPEFIYYLEVEHRRLTAICKKMLESRSLNLDKACKLATRNQLNREALERAYCHRRAMKEFEETEVIKDGDCGRT